MARSAPLVIKPKSMADASTPMPSSANSAPVTVPDSMSSIVIATESPVASVPPAMSVPGSVRTSWVASPPETVIIVPITGSRFRAVSMSRLVGMPVPAFEKSPVMVMSFPRVETAST